MKKAFKKSGIIDRTTKAIDKGADQIARNIDHSIHHTPSYKAGVAAAIATSQETPLQEENTTLSTSIPEKTKIEKETDINANLTPTPKPIYEYSPGEIAALLLNGGKFADYEKYIKEFNEEAKTELIEGVIEFSPIVALIFKGDTRYGLKAIF